MSISDVLCLILGGGRGTRLWPLTKSRAKPAVPVGGKYRLVDVCVSNCLNSGLHRVAVLTQFNSVSLNRHIAQTYHFDFFHSGWVQILAAEQTTTISDWYQGTADAVRKHLLDIQGNTKEVLILAGDHLYRMNYAELIAYHRSNRADVTVAIKPIPRKDAHRFGILKQASDNRITSFTEKPQSESVLADFIRDNDVHKPFLASMGIYVFRTEVLAELLDSDHVDFGSDVIPAAIPVYRVFGYSFDDFWEDIGTIRSYYETSLALTQPNSPFIFNDPFKPIYTRPRFLPGCKIYNAKLDRVLLADGCIMENTEISNSLIGNRSVIEEGVKIRDTVMMGADHYEDYAAKSESNAQKVPPMGIGPGSSIHSAIIDKNARVGAGVRIQPFPTGTDMDEENWTVRDGIVIVPKNAVIPDGAVIAPS